ncbi:hypothetical protein J4218_05330 [Candidatus Pacearchaeota archaeon]|nr:hypothetical protein [Candidatus Pacearchaeota archaeon]
MEIIERAEDFFKVYSDVPIDERRLVVVVLDEEPISWNIAYHEIKNNTDRGRKILKILQELKII